MSVPFPARRFAALLLGVPLLAAACNGAGSTGGPPGSLSLTLSSSTVVAPQDGTQAQLGVAVAGADTAHSVSVALTNLPNGVTAQFTPAASGLTGTIAVTASATAPAGTYSPTVVVTNGNQTASQSFALVVAIAALVGNTTDTSLGVGGRLEEFMATSFQPAEWDFQFFQNHPSSEPGQLSKLGPQHIRLQAVSQAVPMKANSQPQQPSDWDFAMLNAVVQPVLSVGDNSPEFQIAVAPGFMNGSQGHLDLASHLNDFVNYSANLVRYYNKGGFMWGGTLFVSPNPQHPITWWGIFNEYNINGLTPSQYVQLYNAVVPAMLAVDPAIKFSAVELADFDFQEGDPRNNLPTFVAPTTSGGVNAPVDVASTHFYSSCNQKDTDAQIFSSVASFVKDVEYFYQELKSRSDLANVPVWVTENNVNADFNAGNGISACNGTPFVTDQRGTSAFFAAWRPYVFSQLGKAGNRALYHWDYDADAQFGEMDYGSGNTYLSYWVDYWLGQLFPSTGSSPGPEILRLNPTETSTAEILATKNSDGSVVVMVADRAVHASGDNNGPGDSRTVIVDVSALGTFSTATALTLDAKTSASSGPATVSITPMQILSVTLGGYGVTFITLKP